MAKTESALSTLPRLRIHGDCHLGNLLFHEEAPERVAEVHNDEPALRDSWVRAGALWWALQRGRQAHHDWWEALGETFGAPPNGLDLSDAKALESGLLAKVPEVLRQEANFNEELVAARFDAELAAELAPRNGTCERCPYRLGSNLRCPVCRQWQLHRKPAPAASQQGALVNLLREQKELRPLAWNVLGGLAQAIAEQRFTLVILDDKMEMR